MPVLLTKNYTGSALDFETEIHDRVRRGEAGSFFYVVPTKRKVRELQRELLHLRPNKVNPAFHLFTLETLAFQLFSLMCSPRRVLAGPSQALFMHRAFESVRDRQDPTLSGLAYFPTRGTARAVPRGTFQRIINVINTLKESGVYVPVLYQELEAALSGEQAKLRDILAIYEKYEELLGDQFIDSGGVYEELNNSWEPAVALEKFRWFYALVDTIFVAGFDEFSDPEITMLHHLSELHGIGMVISFDYHPGNDELFGHLKENYEKLTVIGFRRILERSRIGPVYGVDSSAKSLQSFKEHIRQNLFRRDAQSFVDFADRVTLLRAADREEEVAFIAKLIKRLVREKPGRDLSKICVAMYRPQMYTSLFREVFARYGIPANITDRYGLSQSPLVVGLLSLLQVAASDFHRRDVLRALSSPYFDFTVDGEKIDAGNLYDISVKLRIEAGRGFWMKRIDQRLVQIADEIREAEDELVLADLQREELQLRKARADVERLASLLRRFDRELLPAEFKSLLLALLTELKVPGQLLRAAPYMNEDQLEKDTRAYQKLLSFLDEFFTVLELQRREAEGLGRGWRLPVYLREMRLAIADVRYNVRQQYGFGVYVTSIEETRGLNFDVMFLAGLVDGEFPPAYRPEIFFSEARRQKKERYHLTEHRYLFYQGLTNFSERLYLSFPRKDGELELVPSSFIDAVTKIVGLVDWRESVPEFLSRPVYSEEELLQRAGRNIGVEMMGGSSFRLDAATVRPEFRGVVEHVRHAITVEHSRLKTHAMPEYEGMISGAMSAGAREKLEAFRERIFSVSQLETYGKCPFQYFALRVLRLNVLEEFEEGLTPLERGGILHDILFEFYLDRRTRKLPPLPECSEEQYRQAVSDLIALARAKLDALQLPDVFWGIEKEFFLGQEERKGALERFLENERQRSLAVEPSYFEVAFGPHVGRRQTSDPDLRWDDPILAENVKLRGKVDRIDVGAGVFSIVDYKTGNTPRWMEIEKGLSLQLPVYLYVVERILSTRLDKPFQPGAALYYKLLEAKEELAIGNGEFRDEAFRSRKSIRVMENAEALRSVIDVAIQFVNQYVNDISRGSFPLTTPDKVEQVCRWCDFQRVCRIQNQMPTALQTSEHDTEESTTNESE